MDVGTNLEFNVILEKIASLSSSSVVFDAVLSSAPTNELKIAQKLLRQTGDAITVLASHRPSLAFEDIMPALAKSKVGATLSPRELLDIKDSVRALKSLKSCVENTSGCDALKDITAYAVPCDDLEHTINAAIENENDIKDDASEKLYGIRKAITRANNKLKEKLDSFTRQSDISKYLQDNIVTVRGGRYVLPVRNDCRSQIKGLVHDVSSTGATVFIEPFAVVEANNELITLKNEENNEIERILAELSALVSKDIPRLSAGQTVLVECGIIFAKAEYAKQQNAYSPIMNDNGRIMLIGARHPLIDRERVVPVDISLDDRRVLLISGPNTGGKTVALKTVGLFAMLAACGIFLPANEGSIMSVFHDIYCDIGDSQSITQSLSTFSAHVSNLSKITNSMNKRSLVLLDEVGDGTDPDEGAALAIAIIKKILCSESTAVVTTHFNSVKEFALACNEIANASMQFDNINLRPTYKLLNGVSGSSYALEIAERLGLDKDIIRDARLALSKEKVSFDKVMREVENLRNQAYYEKQRCEQMNVQACENAQRIQQLKADYEKKLAEINDVARAAIRKKADEYVERADSIIEELKEKLKQNNEAALFDARKIAKKLSEKIPTDEVKPRTTRTPADINELKTGCEVYVNGLNKHGIIVTMPHGNKLTVAIGSIKTEVPISSLELVVNKKSKPAHDNTTAVPEPITREIMLLGKTVDEAITEIDIIIPELPPHSTLRIVHGKGTGILGKGIQTHLKKLKSIKNFRYGRYGEGDTGVTIAEIK